MQREKLLVKVQSMPRLSAALKLTSHITVLFSVILYAFVLYKTFFTRVLCGILTLTVSAVAFFAVSAVRAYIDAPRPYEVYPIFSAPPKNKKGRSFPGRHAFSAFLVATLALPISPVLAIIGLVLGLLLSVSRVLLGIHFVRDVVCGAILGVISGAVGIFTAGILF